MTEKEIVIDASEGVLGRVASFAAKQSLLGKKVTIVNCEKALVTGRRKNILEEYKIARRRGGSSRKGPKFPKSSERIMKRTIRGMLSYKEGRGSEAFKRIMCYDAIPEEFANTKKINLKKELNAKSLELKEVSREL